MKLTTEEYAAKITQASPLGLLLINFDLIIRQIHRSKTAFDAEDINEFEDCIDDAQKFLMVLMSSLDMTFDISQELLSIYLYCNKLLVDAKTQKSADLACSACDILGSIQDSFRLIEKEEKNQHPVMENVERIISGMTYKDGKLCEYVYGNENRGIMA